LGLIADTPKRAVDVLLVHKLCTSITGTSGVAQQDAIDRLLPQNA